MNIDGRVFLLSLLLVPACASRTASDDDDGSSRRLGDGCKELNARYMACYEDDYSTTGYTYESTGYETGEYDPDEYCDYMIEYYTEHYGRNCALAMDDLFACLAEHECEVLEDDNWDNICKRETEQIDKSCDFGD